MILKRHNMWLIHHILYIETWWSMFLCFQKMRQAEISISFGFFSRLCFATCKRTFVVLDTPTFLLLSYLLKRFKFGILIRVVVQYALFISKCKNWISKFRVSSAKIHLILHIDKLTSYFNNRTHLDRFIKMMLSLWKKTHLRW